MNDWNKIEDKLPDRNTRYAARYGVPVLVYDMDEKKDSGSYVPSHASFNFDKKIFEVYAIGPKGGDWIHAFEVTHWKELPEGSKE